MLDDDSVLQRVPGPRAGTKRRRGPKPAFTREEILRRAMDIMDTRGYEALTFRAVGAALRVSHQALYRYFENLADLKDALASGLIAGVRPLNASAPELLREQLVQFGLQLTRTFSLYPNLRQMSGPAGADASGRLHNHNVKVLMASGIDFQRALACQVFIQLVAGGLAELYRSRQAVKASAKKIRTVYVRRLESGLPPGIARKALKNVAANAPPAYRGMFEMIIDAHLPELKTTGARVK